jgi:hypothetical protein
VLFRRVRLGTGFLTLTGARRSEGCRGDPMGEWAAVRPHRGVTDDEVTLGLFELLRAGSGDVTRAHRTVDSDLRRTRAHEAAEPVFAVTCVMLLARS